ncbi:MAG TPA: 2-amino-4-hydroxy-6-hydroxymethyldihydropteridine diphosphokinase [Jatrophihabitans sp.]|jgi:2-amino-4-hydroxy-6-hydroxymethyldihydropteridine diphosphokinase
MSRAVLSIGSNQGDALANLRSAVAAFAEWVVVLSPVVQTPPWGPVPQDDYLNAILIVDDPAATPEDWLARAHEAERQAGRTREVRWGPRTLDIDVVTVATEATPEVLSDDAVLTLPHPRAAARAFVLVPWLAADPDATLGGRPLGALIAMLPADEVAGITPRPELALT